MGFQKKEKKVTMQQRKTYRYLRIIVGFYLIYTGYSMACDLKAGIVADRPKLVVGMAVIFVLVGVLLAIFAFIELFRLNASELKEIEKKEKIRESNLINQNEIEADKEYGKENVQS